MLGFKPKRTNLHEKYDYPLFDVDGKKRPGDDLRLRDGPAVSSGIELPEDLKALDSRAYPASVKPDIGAFPLDSGPLRVGVDGRHAYPQK